ncbi:MAG: G5 domain-containing protein [Eubacterium sp.]
MINESSVVSFKRVSRLASATVIAFVLIVCIFTATAFAGVTGEYDVVINDNGKEYTVTTEETQPIEILNEANITLGANDKLNIAGFTAGEGGIIVVDRLNTVYIKYDEIITAYNVYADTVAEAFSEIGISTENCQIDYSPSARVENGMIINVAGAKTVILNADSTSSTISAIGSTVADVISLAGISLDGDDYVEPALDTAIEDGMEITVYRVTVKTETRKETIKFSTETKQNSDMDTGTSEIEVAGQNGEKQVEYRVTYINGREASKEELSSTVTKEPVTEVKVVGTKQGSVEPNGVQSANGYSVGQTIKGKYTHYCSCAKCCGKSNGVTASGKKVYTGMPNPYYVACNWLPLGSVISVNGTNYTVVDRGGSGLSSGGRIDIYTPEGHQAAIRGGTGSCSITIIRLGW